MSNIPDDVLKALDVICGDSVETKPVMFTKQWWDQGYGEILNAKHLQQVGGKSNYYSRGDWMKAIQARNQACP